MKLKFITLIGFLLLLLWVAYLMYINKIPPFINKFITRNTTWSVITGSSITTWLIQNTWVITQTTGSIITWTNVQLTDKYEVSGKIIILLRNMNFTGLREYIHPSKWVLFSPYEYIDKNRVIVFTSSSITDIINDNKIYTWWTDAASWNPINLTLSGYYKKFIYDVDFSNAPVKNYSENFQRWSMKNNVQEVFPNGFIAEYYFTWFDAKYEGMDWRSLRLVLEQLDWKWYLVWVIHWQWTP